MPAVDDVKSSWADEIEEESPGALPPSTEVIDPKGYKIVTEYKYEDDKKVKIVRTYKVERMIVSKNIAFRKTWKKFGQSANDKPGPDPATTIVGEDVFLVFISSKEEENKPEEDGLEKLKAVGDKGVVKCRKCNGEHWTSKCPYKDTVLNGGNVTEKTPTMSMSMGMGMGMGMGDDKKQAGKYVPPSLRDGAKRVDPGLNPRARDDTTAIRVSNLSESTTEADLEDLVKPFGPIQKLYLAKDKNTNCCKGFAYIHFRFRGDAQKAISALNGHGYDHLILSADWSKPVAPNN